MYMFRASCVALLCLSVVLLLPCLLSASLRVIVHVYIYMYIIIRRKIGLFSRLGGLAPLPNYAEIKQNTRTHPQHSRFQASPWELYDMKNKEGLGYIHI